MRKLVVTTFMTLDGVMQSPGGPDEDPEGGFEHGGWSVNYFDDAVMQEMGEFMGKPFDLVLGRRTYELFAAHWPNASEEEGAKPINEATKYVASRTLRSVDWQNSHILEGDVADAIASLKQEDGPELQVHGSGHLVQTLIRNGLIDEFHLLIFPLVLGKGKRLFEGGTVPSGLELIDHKVSSSGVMMATYRPSGEVVTGEFAVARA
jgi:dihydrofolate reductase